MMLLKSLKVEPYHYSKIQSSHLNWLELRARADTSDLFYTPEILYSLDEEILLGMPSFQHFSIFLLKENGRR